MGFFWDLVQHSQINQQRERSNTLEQRVADLEEDVRETHRVLKLLLEHLEKQSGTDINQDGRIG